MAFQNLSELHFGISGSVKVKCINVVGRPTMTSYWYFVMMYAQLCSFTRYEALKFVTLNLTVQGQI